MFWYTEHVVNLSFGPVSYVSSQYISAQLKCIFFMYIWSIKDNSLSWKYFYLHSMYGERTLASRYTNRVF